MPIEPETFVDVDFEDYIYNDMSWEEFLKKKECKGENHELF